jgi:hypothetical protein
MVIPNGYGDEFKRESDGRKIGHVALEAMRLQAVKAVRGGQTVESVAKAYGMRSDHHAGRTWAPSGETPEVQATGRRFSLNMLSAVSARGDFRFMVHEGSVTQDVFLEFLHRLMRGAQEPIILVLDGHPIHKAKKMPQNMEQLKSFLKSVLARPRKLPEIVRSFFRHPDCQYAIM